jgi:hypothetical protein
VVNLLDSRWAFIRNPCGRRQLGKHSCWISTFVTYVTSAECEFARTKGSVGLSGCPHPPDPRRSKRRSQDLQAVHRSGVFCFWTMEASLAVGWCSKLGLAPCSRSSSAYAAPLGKSPFEHGFTPPEVVQENLGQAL